MLAIDRILHPTDFSSASAHAFALACSLARDYGATLVVCHVAPPPAAAVVEGMMVAVPPDEEQEARNRLARIHPSDPMVNVAYRLERGDAVRDIVRVAGEEHADLIVMGTHGRGGLTRVLMGSVAEGVMRKAPCPVITIRPAHAETAEGDAEKVETAAAS